MGTTTPRRGSGHLLLLLLLVLGLLVGPATAALARGGPPDHAGPSQGRENADRGNPDRGNAPEGRPAASGASTATSDTGGSSTATSGEAGSTSSGGETDGEAETVTATGSGGARELNRTTTGPAADGGTHCREFFFAYTDGHTDSGTWCGRGQNVTSNEVPGLHVPLLHVSCSDTFSVVVPGGTTSDGASDLGRHVIKPEGWWIKKDRGAPCGFPDEPPPPTDPVCHLTVLVKHHGTGTLVPGGTGSVTTTDGTTTRELGGSTDWGQVPCGDVSGRLTSPPATYTTVIGSDATTIPGGTRGELVFTVLPAGDCVGPLMIEVRHADTNDIVAVTGASATIAGTTRDLDADGVTAGGSFVCGTSVAGTLLTPPVGYVTVDGDDTTTVTATGGTLVFTVRQTPGGPAPCVAPLVIDVVDLEGNRVQGGGATATIAGSATELDDDGRTSGGSYLCGTTVAGTLDTPPDGYVIVDGSDVDTILADVGGRLVFVVALPADVGGVTEECIGGVIVRVVTEDGDPIGGATVVVGDRTRTVPVDGTEFPAEACGELTATITEPPSGHSVVGEPSGTVTIRNDETAEVVFVVAPLEVGGVIIERPDPAGSLLAPGAPGAPDAPATSATSAPGALARTGAASGGLLSLSAAVLLVGLMMLGLARPERSPRPRIGWSRR